MTKRVNRFTYVRKEKKIGKLALTLYVFGRKCNITNILIPFCIFTIGNDFIEIGQVSLKSGYEWGSSKLNLFDSGRLGPDFSDFAPRMKTRKESDISVVKLVVLLN